MREKTGMKQNDLWFIGLTGQAGCGKSKVCELLKEHFHAEILEADRIARELCEPGGECLKEIRKAFPMETLYLPDGSMNRPAFAELVFHEEKKRNQLNHIVYPAVKRYIINRLEQERREGRTGMLVLESAQLLEDGYDKICDELWYVYAPASVRKQRLITTRGYSEEKIEGLFRAQKTDEEFLKHCAHVIDNSGSAADTLQILKTLVRERRNERNTE